MFNSKINIMVVVLKQGATKEAIEKLLKKLKIKRGVNTKKYCGTIKLKEDPLTIQKNLRDEWE